MEKKSYYAVIPADVRYDKRLSANAKLLYGEITALCNSEGYCWAENSYFAELYEASIRSVQGWIKSLVDCGYIKSKLIYKEGGREVEKRYLTLVNTPGEEIFTTPCKNFHDPMKKFSPPHEKNCTDNNTLNNTLNNTTNNKKENTKRKSTDFQPPTLEEVQAYCKERNSTVDPKQFYEYFTVGEWKDSKGNPVRNWKQKLLTWERMNNGSQRVCRESQSDQTDGALYQQNFVIEVNRHREITYDTDLYGE